MPASAPSRGIIAIASWRGRRRRCSTVTGSGGCRSRRCLPQPCATAAAALVGRHDFTTFRAAGCQAKSPVKTLDRLEVTALGDEIVIEASARSFLHNQVRSMVGSLKLVGEGKWSAGDLAAALAAKDRAACGPVAPARGLYLMQVDYAPDA